MEIEINCDTCKYGESDPHFNKIEPYKEPCPLVKWCPSRTAPCAVMPPDSGCYWYRYFRQLPE